MIHLTKMFILLFISLLLQLFTYHCFPNGGPVESCESLLPRHAGTKPSDEPSPYYFTTTSDHYDNINDYSPTKGIIVEIAGHPFAGFFVVAFDPHTGENIGSWAKLEGTKILPCSAITHINSKTKKLASLLWIPPPKKKGFVAFGATIAKSFSEYYTGIIARTLQRDEQLSV